MRLDLTQLGGRQPAQIRYAVLGGPALDLPERPQLGFGAGHDELATLVVGSSCSAQNFSSSPMPRRHSRAFSEPGW